MGLSPLGRTTDRTSHTAVGRRRRGVGGDPAVVPPRSPLHEVMITVREEKRVENGGPTASHRSPRRAYRGSVAALPPDDADRWSDEEWLAWLEEVDAETPPEPEGRPVRPRRSVPTQMLGAAMLGLHRVIYGDSEPDVQIVVDADGEPPDPEQLEVHLDPEDPDASTVTVRPWVEGH